MELLFFIKSLGILDGYRAYKIFNKIADNPESGLELVSHFRSKAAIENNDIERRENLIKISDVLEDSIFEYMEEE